MELTPLRYVVAIAEHGHMTRAAQALGVSQPTLSASVRRLEDEVGAALFHRTAKGVELTDAGRVFVEHASAAIAQVEGGVEAVGEMVGLNRGRIRIGGGATAVGYLLPGVIRAFRDRHPAIRLYLREAASRDVARAVRNAELDMGLVTLPLAAGDEGELVVIARRRDELKLAVPGDHRLAGRKTFRWADVEGEEILAFEAGSAVRRVIDEAAAAQGVSLRVVMELRAIDVIVRLVRESVGLAFVSGLALEAEGGNVGGLSCRDGKIVREFGLVRRADFTPSAAVEAFEGLLVGAMRGARGGV